MQLSGAVSNPAISGTSTPGSGIDAVRVSLLNPAGKPAGTPWQTAQVNGNRWTLDYTLSNITVAGPYAVTATAADTMKNSVAATPVIIHIDSQPPTVTGLAGVDIAFSPAAGCSAAFNKAPPSGQVAQQPIRACV